MSSRDMGEREFLKRLDRYGMRPAIMGYVKVTDNTSVYRYNAGERRRDQLAYLIQQQAMAVQREQAMRATQ